MHIEGREIDPILFRKGFPAGCGPFACESTCCSAGVYVDLAEKERILSNKETIRKYLDETQSSDHTRWFDAEIVDDPDFPSGKAVGTEVVGGKCVFLNKSGRCSLQIAGMEEKIGRWALKPFYCIAFPITVEDGIVTFDDYLDEKRQCCSALDKSETPLFEACRDELEFVLGTGGYEEMIRTHKDVAATEPPSTSVNS